MVLRQLLLLTDTPSADGISFGEIHIVVVKFDKPANAALLATITDGNTVVTAVQAPPSPPSTTPPAPDMFAMHAGITPDIFYSQLDGTQVSILESGLLNAGYSTGSILLYYWSDTLSYSWNLEINGVTKPEYMPLRIFEDLWNTPVLFNVTPDQPWSPDTVSYSGTFTDAQLREALAAAGHPEASLNNHTPDIFLELIDGGGGLAIEDQAGLSAAPAPEGGQVGAVAAARRRGLLQEVANDTAAAGTCGAGEPSRIIGFIFDSVSRYKLKPVLKDTTSLPKSIVQIPLYVSAGIIGLLGLAFISMHVSGTLEEASLKNTLFRLCGAKVVIVETNETKRGSGRSAAPKCGLCNTYIYYRFASNALLTQFQLCQSKQAAYINNVVNKNFKQVLKAPPKYSRC
ncbi:nitrate ABC transporter substrate-binding [Micractinium conductrix]|uniref:Nitrate ABC transporter substrate-binding n=1 Tax=Micractinium conductrix TaxID=554055 RepID=A0A2P6VRX2_9CHLO|nr:nitrate ABC transporter substrate-binding [Micractinium conductrix]|eukprot:PSC76817.1 nitrate ABC transporter substrate-binding [Micractinium conductrix]